MADVNRSLCRPHAHAGRRDERLAVLPDNRASIEEGAAQREAVGATPRPVSAALRLRDGHGKLVHGGFHGKARGASGLCVAAVRAHSVTSDC